jgi:beta-N-acetylhexosaminidase
VTSRELSAVGINMDMAPVLDIALPGRQGIMKDRAFGDDPLWVSCLGTELIVQLQECGTMAVAKHFPGIGKTIMDSHIDRPELDTDLVGLKKDLIPFGSAIQSRVAGIMLSHIVYQRIDPEWPASLSVNIARDLLRNRLGFTGVVMTDDLDMGAIVKHYDLSSSIDQIFRADIDIALICHPDPKIETAFERFLACQSASAAADRKARAAVERIMKLKRTYLGC